MQATMEQETVIIPELTPLQRLAAVKAQIEDFNKQIEQDKLIYGIKLLEQNREARQKEYNDLLDQIVPTLEFSEDKFLKALKKNGESYKEGSLKLIRHATTRRKVLTEKFLATFPASITNRCVKVELTKADRAVGKDTMEDFVEKEISYSYELQDLSKPDGN